MTVFAWMEDWQMSARLAKLSTTYSYQLIFCESLAGLPKPETQIVIIIDLRDMNEKDLEQIQDLQNNNSFFILGYTQTIDGGQVKYFKAIGCDMVLRRNKLLKNLESILKKINNAG
ncbi:MAG: hypothetical protein H8E85_08405 [Candidatus Marinimicrobia bacterium]|nr:hypothetical protein [Candidatus Neomarinimicrobiota bacterium]